MPHAGVLQIHGVHQVVQGDMRIAPAQTSKHGSEQSQKGIHGIAAKCTEQQIEPNHIGLQFPQPVQKSNGTQGIIE